MALGVRQYVSDNMTCELGLWMLKNNHVILALDKKGHRDQEKTCVWNCSAAGGKATPGNNVFKQMCCFSKCRAAEGNATPGRNAFMHTVFILYPCVCILYTYPPSFSKARACQKSFHPAFLNSMLHSTAVAIRRHPLPDILAPGLQAAGVRVSRSPKHS